jgi:hypothetical protein
MFTPSALPGANRHGIASELAHLARERRPTLAFVMAYDGWLRGVIAQFSPETGVPKTAILLFCVITAIFAALPFGDLAASAFQAAGGEWAASV